MPPTDTGLVIEPRAGWLHRPVPDGNDDADDLRADRLVARLQARLAARREFTGLLGLTFRDTTMLPLHGGGSLGPARTVDGYPMKWWLWAPSRKVLIDVFVKRLPPESELRAREAFATEHGLRYAVVPPDRRLTPAVLKAWLEEIAA